MKTEKLTESLGLTRLPEWRATLDAMREKGVEYGARFEVKFFEAHLKMDSDDMRFSLSISKIRKELEKEGFYLSGRGGRKKYWTILPPSENAAVMVNYGNLAAAALSRGVILGTSTRLDTLEEGERARHEAVLERMAIKASLVARVPTLPKLKGGK